VTLKWSDVKEAERNMARTEIEARSTMKQCQAAETASKAVYDQELDKLRDLEKDEKFYRMVAPQSGMVVYYIPEQARFGGGAQQGTVAQGEPVREGQKLIRIPNLAKMLVSARVHEAMVSKVRGEVFKPTGFADTLRFSLTLGRHDPLGLTAYYAGMEQFKEEHRDKEQTLVFPGHKAKIRIDAFPGKVYEGHVKTVATVASQAEFFSSDVKVYTTMVSIDDLDPSSEKLKPGMSAEVTILADETPDKVLIIPIQSVIGNVAMQADRKCFVLDAKGVAHERDIKVGLSNDKYVEVLEGLEEGEKIVLNPRPLIPEKSDMKPGTPGTRRGAEFDDGGKKGGKKKGDGGFKGGGGGPGGMPPDGGGKTFQRPDAVPQNPQDRGGFKKAP
jgi:multidrug efflux pump subunit AcrA (membrane-fusion protein)